jgi:hypothetical protein
MIAEKAPAVPNQVKNSFSEFGILAFLLVYPTSDRRSDAALVIDDMAYAAHMILCALQGRYRLRNARLDGLALVDTLKPFHAQMRQRHAQLLQLVPQPRPFCVQ